MVPFNGACRLGVRFVDLFNFNGNFNGAGFINFNGAGFICLMVPDLFSLGRERAREKINPAAFAHHKEKINPAPFAQHHLPLKKRERGENKSGTIYRHHLPTIYLKRYSTRAPFSGH